MKPKRPNCAGAAKIYALIAAMLVWSGPALASCYNGYCQSSSSPVIGGWTNHKKTCHSLYNGQICYTGFRPFGNVTVPSGDPAIGYGSFTGTRPTCTGNTAQIKMPHGYKANNGTWYNWTGYSYYTSAKKAYDNGSTVYTVVCVKSDTF